MSLALRLLPAVAVLATVAPVRAQDPAAGGQSFLQCADCHSPGDNDGVGPGLKGVVGRHAGRVATFKYSDALAKSTLVWDDATLDRFLANPKAAVPGTSMDFPGVTDEKERADLIAYLKTLK